MIRFSDNRVVAAMTTIITFLPTGESLIKPFFLRGAEKTLVWVTQSFKTSANCKMKVVASLILCLTTVALADDFKLIDGKEYKNVTVSRVEPDGIVLRTKSGISKIYFVELPKDVQERFHYNAAIAAAYSAQGARQAGLVTGRGQPVEVI